MLLSPSSQQIERWIGDAAQVEALSRSYKGWYGSPIPVILGNGNVIYVHGDGDFSGLLRAGIGEHSSHIDYAMGRYRRKIRRWAHRQMSTLNTGFAGASDMLSEEAAGKSRQWVFVKSGPTEVGNTGASTFWRVGPVPQVGSTPSAAPGGNAVDSTTTGAHPMDNPTSPDTRHIKYGTVLSSVIGTFQLYDRIFHVLKNMAITTAESVTGVPTRYQSTTPGAADYIGNNFVFIEVNGTQLSATAHNHTMNYNDQADSASVTPAMAGNSGAIVDRLDHPLFSWFMPLAAGDTGVKKITSMTLSATIAAGTVNYVIGHNLAAFPCRMVSMFEGLNFEYGDGGPIIRLFDSACLAWLSIYSTSSSPHGFDGRLFTVDG